MAVAGLLRPEFTPEGELDQHPIRFAEVLTKRTFDFPEDQWHRIEDIRREATETLQTDLVREADERGGHAVKMTIDMMRMKYGWEALKLAGVDPAKMPGYVPVAEVPIASGMKSRLWTGC
jgi:hypothetical protein